MSLSYTLLPRAHCISVHHHRRIKVKGAEARRSFYLRWGQLLIDIVFRTALQTDFLGLLVAGSEVLYLCFSLSCVLVLVAAVMLLLAAADLLWRSTGRGNELSWRRRLWSCNHVAGTVRGTTTQWGWKNNICFKSLLAFYGLSELLLCRNLHLCN